MKIRFATAADFARLNEEDEHITPERLRLAIEQKRVLVAEEKAFAGWLRFSWFWDSIPFVDMLFVLEPYRHQKFGTALMQFFEKEMLQQGNTEIMTSTSSEEYAQHLYHKLGYKTVGGFFPKGDPYEMILMKHLR